MDNIILSIINNQTLVDIIQELHPNWSKKIRPYEDLQSFLLSADNNQISEIQCSVLFRNGMAA